MGLDFSGLGQRQVSSCFEHGNESLGSIKCEEFLDRLRNRSEEGLCSLELVNTEFDIFAN
jgi:hypothetical protein